MKMLVATRCVGVCRGGHGASAEPVPVSGGAACAIEWIKAVAAHPGPLLLRRCLHAADPPAAPQCDACGTLLNPTELINPKCKMTGKLGVDEWAGLGVLDAP